MGMAIAGGRKGGGRRRRGGSRHGAMADINMTPFIDVMLVLLIIFMVAAPLLATGVPIDLPKTKAAALNIEHQPVAVAVDEKGIVYVLDKPVPIEQLADKLKEVAKDGMDERIYVRGASGVNYGKVAEVMTIITSSGYKKVALVTDPSKN